MAAAAAASTATARRWRVVGAFFFPRAERGAAATASDRIRVVDLKATTQQRVDKVDIGAGNILRPHRIDAYRQAVRLEVGVAGMGLVVERHAILKTRAAATGDKHAQGIPFQLLL